jgi:stage V sporulation protein D (sporulation-specific penicillin-binding protein)
VVSGRNRFATVELPNFETKHRHPVLLPPPANSGCEETSGGGRNAQVQGYEIGGKTGTSEPNPAHPENGYVASFLAIAPVEDSKLVCLLTLYHPTKNSIFGGKIAAPAVSQILTEVLPYLEIPSTKTQTTAKETKQTVPNLKGLSKTEANKKLVSLGLECITLCEGDEIITEQNPRAGTQLVKGGKVRLYSKEHSEPVMTTVPNLKGVSYEQAKNMLMSKNLNISSTGSGIVIAQDPTASTSVEEGSIVSIILQNKTNDNQN